jgi:hypothetical protein
MKAGVSMTLRFLVSGRGRRFLARTKAVTSARSRRASAK